MSDRLESYIDHLQTASGKTGKVRDGIESVIDTFVAATNSRGEPWGNDTLGNQFAEGKEGYKATKANLVLGANNMAGTFNNFSTGQAKAAKELREMEETNAKGLR
ncbi:hypothetical protein [Nocardia sp. NPDC050406]|uniref:hypothetical protein n=1 Tax=Nocardia sp. NPDC050406 TaxID=3364318 RepID=UPI00379E2023